MKTHTTTTDLRRIMKLHDEGLSAKDISEQAFINVKEVEKVIKVRTKKAK